MTRRICIVTGSRAEYGLLRLLMEQVRRDPDVQLQIIATGTHLSPEFGLTYREIEQDGFRIDEKVEMLLSSDTTIGIAKSMGLATIGFADALQRLRPDMVVLLGDRFEAFSVASAAMVLRIPIAHIHGGERTEGAFDEAIRHSITKMAHLHFVAAPEYEKRVVQLGEEPGRVFLVGGLGVDAILNTKLLNRAELEASLDFSLGRRSLLVTFHPVTLEDQTAAEQINELLIVLGSLEETNIIFTLPNADSDGRSVTMAIKRFVEERANCRAYTSLGSLRYLSCIKHVDGVVGNSSSGLAEVPSFGKGTINIGDRQRGRLRAESVIDCAPDRESIAQAVNRLYSAEFQSRVKSARNPYGEGGACGRILNVIKKFPLDGILKKTFYDLAPD